MGKIAILIVVMLAILLLLDEFYGNRYLSQIIKQVV